MTTSLPMDDPGLRKHRLDKVQVVKIERILIDIPGSRRIVLTRVRALELGRFRNGVGIDNVAAADKLLGDESKHTQLAAITHEAVLCQTSRNKCGIAARQSDDEYRNEVRL